MKKHRSQFSILNSPFSILHSPFSILHSPFFILLLVTTALYAHTLDFGFIWDDPLWYGRVVGRSVGELIRPMPDYHFYRPTLVLYNRLFVRADGTLAAPLLHAAQLGWHLLNVALVYALSRSLGLGRWTATAAGALVAWYPLSYQAVAWAAPAQPMAAVLQNSALLAYAVSRRPAVMEEETRFMPLRGRPRRDRPYIANAALTIWFLCSLFLFLVALTVQEGAAALAALPLLMEWVWYRGKWRVFVSRAWPALLYPLVAAGFGLLWLQIPREAGYTALTLESRTLLYFLQGLTFPLWGRPWGYGAAQSIPPVLLLALSVMALGLLLVAAWRAGRGKRALLGLSWALLGIAPAAVGLEYSYVKLGSRLFYYAAPGLALLWAASLSQACAAKPGEGQGEGEKPHLSTLRLWRIGGAAILLLILSQSFLLLGHFRRTYTPGVAHMDEMIQTQAEDDGDRGSDIYINFPDRYTPQRPPYPLGYWGMTLAPVSVDLSDFADVTLGTSDRTISRSMPWIDTQAREAGPYRVDMRGLVAQPDELYRLARGAGEVYISRYAVDGSFSLQWAGTVASAPPQTCRMAVFSRTVCLQDVRIERRAGELALDLTWLSLSEARPHDTIFVHLGAPDQPPVAQADGDAWHGILPLSVWRAGDLIRERRAIPLPEDAESEGYEIQVGIYNRVTGERLPARTHAGESLPDGALIIEQRK